MKLHLLLASTALILQGASPESWCAAKLQSLDYPALALQARISGVVRLAAQIGRDGTVIETRIISGSEILGGAARENLRSWKFMRCSLSDSNRAREVDYIEIVYDFVLAGQTLSAPRTQFSYEHPGRVTVTSAAPHWVP
jgi:TonB family protein